MVAINVEKRYYVQTKYLVRLNQAISKVPKIPTSSGMLVVAIRNTRTLILAPPGTNFSISGIATDSGNDLVPGEYFDSLGDQNAVEGFDF